MKKYLFLFFLSISCVCLSQENNQNDWTKTEKAQYQKLTELANYVYKKKKKEISKDSLFNAYIYFDYVLNDTSTVRKERRLVKFDTIFYFFRQKIDSIGLKNLDAKPIRFYKDHEIYKPFIEENAPETVGGKKMNPKSEHVFVYYEKNKPEIPLGRLLFEPRTCKLVSWIMLQQGRTYYFLTFNIL